MLETKKKQAPPKIFVVREESFFLEESSIFGLEKSEETSLPARRDRDAPRLPENQKKAPSNFTKKKMAARLPVGTGRDPRAGPLLQQLRREAPPTSRERRKLCLPFCRQQEYSFLS